ncbi:hypothetical protein DIC82_16650 [Clostridium beijerinckii]|nr:hypothetical protein DIC82_16650 [Clostridium beijerinckii]
MIETINNLYNLVLFILAGSVVVLLITVGYVIGIIKYFQKYMIFNKDLENIIINNIMNKDNI